MKSARHERNYGIDCSDYRDLVITRGLAYLAIQHRLGLLPERRIGINSVDPDRASVAGKIVKAFRSFCCDEFAVMIWARWRD